VSEIAPTGGWTVGQVLQLADGRAAVVSGTKSPAAGQMTGLQVGGHRKLTKTASVVVLDGCQLYWDRSANTATPLRAVAGSDFPIGTAVGDATAAAATVVCDLNTSPHYTIDLLRDPCDRVLTSAAGTAVLENVGGVVRMAFGASAEVETISLITQASVPMVAGSQTPFIVEGRIVCMDNGDAAAGDVNIGVANAAHASDFDGNATEFFTLKFNTNDLLILAQSDDGTTDVAEVDTTVAFVEGTYFDFAMDCRAPADCQLYLDGVNVLAATVFDLSAIAANPLKLIAHMEKTSDDTPGEFRIAKLGLRTMDIT
jgi:predicted RecA/RadA family phage recombinase